MNQKKSITVNAIARVVMYSLNLLIPLLVGPYLARVLDVDLYADYNAGVSFLQWFLILAIFGMYTFGMRQTSRVRDNLEQTRRIFTQLFVFGIITTTVVWLGYMGFVLLAKSDQFWLYTLLGIQLVANYFAIEWINEAFENYTFILYKTALVRLAYVVSIFIFVKSPGDILPFTAIASIVVFLNNFLGYLYIKRKVTFVRIHLRELKALIKPLFFVLLLTNANMLFLMLDRLFLSVLSPVKVYITYYTFAMMIMTALMNVVSSIMYVTVPRLSNYLSNNNRDEYNSLLRVSSHSFFIIAIPMCAGIAALGPEVMYLFGGENYIGAASTMVVFGLRFIVNAIDLSLSNQVLFINGMEKKLLRIYFLAGGINFLFNIGLYLAGCMTPVLLITTTAICDIVVITLQHITIGRLYGKNISPLDKTTIKYIVISLCFIPIAMAFRYILEVEFVINLKLILFILVTMTACMLFYCIFLYATKDPYYACFIQKLKNRGKKIFHR